MAIRGLEGNQNAQPRVFAHDALDLKPGNYTLGNRIANTDTIGCALYVGAAMDLTVTLEGGTTVLLKGITAGSFLPMLITHVTATSVTLAAGGGELIALY